MRGARLIAGALLVVAVSVTGAPAAAGPKADGIVENRTAAVQAARRQAYERRAFECADGQVARFLAEGVRSKQVIVDRAVRVCANEDYAAALGIGADQDRAYLAKQVRERLNAILSSDHSPYKNPDQ